MASEPVPVFHAMLLCLSGPSAPDVWHAQSEAMGVGIERNPWWFGVGILPRRGQRERCQWKSTDSFPRSGTNRDANSPLTSAPLRVLRGESPSSSEQKPIKWVAPDWALDWGPRRSRTPEVCEAISRGFSGEAGTPPEPVAKQSAPRPGCQHGEPFHTRLPCANWTTRELGADGRTGGLTPRRSPELLGPERGAVTRSA
jgi:hypothetical protein